MKRILLRIIDIISVMILAASLLILLTVVFTKSGKTPNLFGCSVLRVMSGSMEPEIRTNAVIVVRKADVETLKVGDIISYYSDDPSLQGMVNTHRITEIETDTDGQPLFTTRGDANAAADLYKVKAGKIVGRVIWQSYTVGRILSLLSNPLIFIPVILCPLLLILISGIVRSVKITKQMVEEEEREAALEAVEQIRKIKEAAEETVIIPEADAIPEEVKEKLEPTSVLPSDEIGQKAGELKEMAKLLEENLRAMQKVQGSKVEGQESNGRAITDQDGNEDAAGV